MKAVDFVEYVASLDCDCQSRTKRNEHSPLCMVGKAQIFLGQRVFIQGDNKYYEHDVYLCEHNIPEGDWCEKCNYAYKIARTENRWLNI